MATEYTVLSIDELTRVSETKGIERYYRHRIKTKGGVIMTVDIDEAVFLDEKTAPILAKRAIIADKTLAL